MTRTSTRSTRPDVIRTLQRQQDRALKALRLSDPGTDGRGHDAAILAAYRTTRNLRAFRQAR